MKTNALAEFFYEQCAGTSSGHMANVPNNPVLFALVAAAAGKQGNIHAATKEQFAAMLREMADQLDS